MIDNCFERRKRKVWKFICAVLQTFIAAYFVVLLLNFICGIIENINGYEFPAVFAPYFSINYGLFEGFFTSHIGVSFVAACEFVAALLLSIVVLILVSGLFEHMQQIIMVSEIQQFSATAVPAVVTATQIEAGYNLEGVSSPITIRNGLKYAPTNGILAATNNGIGGVFADVRNTSNIKKKVINRLVSVRNKQTKHKTISKQCCSTGSNVSIQFFDNIFTARSIRI